MRGLIFTILSLLLIGCGGSGIPSREGKTPPVIGTWGLEDVRFTFYPDQTGLVEDSIEGDSIYYWELQGKDSMMFVVDEFYPETVYVKVKVRGNTLTMDDTLRFRKIGN